MTVSDSNRRESEAMPESNDVIEPPRTVVGIVRKLGPGLIIAGSIVGSGELIATTKTGAEAGFWLLWLIVIGCVIKFFTQVEFGRYAISSRTTTMAALNQVPGPRWGVNWILWYWLVMFVVSLAQLGGIVGGVGQSLAMSVPISGDFNRLLDEQDTWDQEAKPELLRLRQSESLALMSQDRRRRSEAVERIQRRLADTLGRPRPNWATRDDAYWAALVTAITVVILVVGRYGLVQNLAVVLVASFTLITLVNLVVLQSEPAWAVQWSDLRDGMRFRLPPVVEGLVRSPLATALAAFGIIGVGANELIAYPYWCLEKGYARFTGPCDETPQWAERARGWLRVMRWDASLSMVIYTFATVAFYLLGAAVLHREGLDPAGNRMIHVLCQMYEPVFGGWALWLFLFGAFAVLYSTFFVSNAGHARVAADALRVFGLRGESEPARLWWVRSFCVAFPTFSLIVYLFIRAPAQLILASGVMQAIMLPMLAGATLYFRYVRCDRRITPGRLWDVMLWISAAGLLLAGGWLALSRLLPALDRVG